MRLFSVLSLLCFAFQLAGQWTNQDSIDSNISQTKALSFVDASTGYAAVQLSFNAQATIYKTTDGALSWTNLNFPTNATAVVQGMHFISASTGFLAVRENDNGNLHMNVYTTTDGGQSWTSINPSTNDVGSGVSEIHFVNPDTGYFALSGCIFNTTDAGQNWSVDTLNNTYYALHSIDFWDSQHGVAGGYDGTFAYMGVLFYTNDGGQTWNEVMIPQTYTSIEKVQRVSATHIYALASAYNSRYLFRSMDAGQSWDTLNLSSLANGSQDEFKTMFFNDINNGFVGTSAGQILRTNDAGLNWTPVYSFNGSNNLSVTNIDFGANVGYAINNQGKIAKYSISTAAETLAINSEIKCYPNPCIESFTIQCMNCDYSIEIVDAVGRRFFDKQNCSNDLTIRTSEWQEGVYFGSLKQKNGLIRAFKIHKKNTP